MKREFRKATSSKNHCWSLGPLIWWDNNEELIAYVEKFGGKTVKADTDGLFSPLTPNCIKQLFTSCCFFVFFTLPSKQILVLLFLVCMSRSTVLFQNCDSHGHIFCLFLYLSDNFDSNRKFVLHVKQYIYYLFLHLRDWEETLLFVKWCRKCQKTHKATRVRKVGVSSQALTNSLKNAFMQKLVAETTLPPLICRGLIDIHSLWFSLVMVFWSKRYQANREKQNMLCEILISHQTRIEYVL